jgi:hypothetical protein
MIKERRLAKIQDLSKAHQRKEFPVGIRMQGANGQGASGKGFKESRERESVE